MKCATTRKVISNNIPLFPHPNSVTRQEVLNKMLDLLLMGAIGAGLAACLIFILVLF